jgi:hypothetical protein
MSVDRSPGRDQHLSLPSFSQGEVLTWALGSVHLWLPSCRPMAGLPCRGGQCSFVNCCSSVGQWRNAVIGEACEHDRAVGGRVADMPGNRHETAPTSRHVVRMHMAAALVGTSEGVASLSRWVNLLRRSPFAPRRLFGRITAFLCSVRFSSCCSPATACLGPTCAPNMRAAEIISDAATTIIST